MQGAAMLDALCVLSFASITTAPRDGSMLALLTSDGEIVTGFWDDTVTNFYASQIGWKSYDPAKQRGDWVSMWCPYGDDGDDRRLYCGMTPIAWAALPTRDVLDRIGALHD